jgi:hypothetical protein
MKITRLQAKRLGHIFNINFKVIDFDDWVYGLNVELEHGKRRGLTNVTNDNLQDTAKIAIAHLLEYPDYYKRLKKMERLADKYWKRKPKRDIFL